MIFFFCHLRKNSYLCVDIMLILCFVSVLIRFKKERRSREVAFFFVFFFS